MAAQPKKIIIDTDPGIGKSPYLFSFNPVFFKVCFFGPYCIWVSEISTFHCVYLHILDLKKEEEVNDSMYI